MVESESFIKEVSEEVKRDILFKTLKKFKWPIIALIILLVELLVDMNIISLIRRYKAQEIGEFFVSAIENLKIMVKLLLKKLITIYICFD